MASDKPVAIVSGGADGLGNAIVRELLDNFYKVCICDINEKKGNTAVVELQKKYGDSNVIFHHCDVSEKSQYADVFEYTLSQFKRLNLLVNNAGILDESDLMKMIGVNLLGPINGCELALKYMGKDNGGTGGFVINVASAAGLVAMESAPVYSATKHGVVGLTKAYGMEYHYKKSGVLFSALCPFTIDTNMLPNAKTLIPEVDFTKLKNKMEPSYVAKAVMKLIQDEKNGGVLLVSVEKTHGYKYIGLGELEGVIN